MKLKRLISLMLILIMTLSLVCGCKSAPQEEESAAADDWVEVEDNNDSSEQKEESKKPSNKGESQNKEEQKEENKKPSTDSTQKEENQEDDQKDEQKPSSKPEEEQKNPAEDSKEPENEGEEEAPAQSVIGDKSGTPVTILVQNLKHSGTSLGSKDDGTTNNIYNRIRRFKSMVDTHDPDVILGQELRIGWVEAFKSNLFAQSYGLLFRERGPAGVPGGDEGTALLYKKSKYKLEESGFFWLSDTPKVPSRFFDDSGEYGRIIAWAKLKDKATGMVFYCYSNHFGFGKEGPLKAQAQFNKLFDELPEGSYAFVGGDWNVLYRDDDYMMMMDWEKVFDLRDMCMNLKDDGFDITFGGMNGSGTGGRFDANEPDPTPGNQHQIDYLMAKPNPHLAVDYYGFDYKGYTYPADGVKEGYIADHYGLVVKLRIGTEADYSKYQCVHTYEEKGKYYWR